MQGTLVLAILNVKSSYIRETEESLAGSEDVPDTLQWWIDANGVWRIKTFALDHDIHTYSVGGHRPDMVELACANNQKHYGDVVAAQHVVEFTDCEDPEEVSRHFQQLALPARLEVAEGRFAFWKPDDAEYRTQSSPK